MAVRGARSSFEHFDRQFGLVKRAGLVYTARMSNGIRVYTGGSTMCNGYLIEGADGYVAIDAPAGFAAWVKQQMPDRARLTHLLLTHQHFDHVEDAAQLKADTGCLIHAHSPYDRRLTLEDFARLDWGLKLNVAPYRVDDVMGDQRSHADWGGLKWQIIPLPGHSPDSLVYRLDERQTLFTGDVLFAGSVGRTDFPGGSQRSLLNGIEEKLEGLDPQLSILSGHGPATTLQEELLNNPWLC